MHKACTVAGMGRMAETEVVTVEMRGAEGSCEGQGSWDSFFCCLAMCSVDLTMVKGCQTASCGDCSPLPIHITGAGQTVAVQVSPPCSSNALALIPVVSGETSLNGSLVLQPDS